MSFPQPSPFIPVEHDARTDFTYDTNHNLLSFKVRSGGLVGKVLGTITMTYDENNNITSQLWEKTP